MEEWRYIKATDKKYQISNYGRIRESVSHKPVPLKIINGYYRVVLNTVYGPATWALHIMVASTFVHDHPEGCEHVQHLDGNRANNRVDNLVWCNMYEIRYAHPTVPLGNNAKTHSRYCSTIYKIDYVNNKIIDTFDNVYDAAKSIANHKVPVGLAVTRILSSIRSNGTTAGYRWSYDKP